MNEQTQETANEQTSSFVTAEISSPKSENGFHIEIKKNDKPKDSSFFSTPSGIILTSTLCLVILFVVLKKLYGRFKLKIGKSGVDFEDLVDTQTDEITKV